MKNQNYYSVLSKISSFKAFEAFYEAATLQRNVWFDKLRKNRGKNNNIDKLIYARRNENPKQFAHDPEDDTTKCNYVLVDKNGNMIGVDKDTGAFYVPSHRKDVMFFTYEGAMEYDEMCGERFTLMQVINFHLVLVSY